MPIAEPVEDRFPRYVMEEPNSGCHLWIGTMTKDGYGTIKRSRSRKCTYAHVLAWEFEHGPVHEGYEVDHLCRNVRCVNPRHLESVTRKVNQQRMGAAWRREHPNCPRCQTPLRTHPSGQRWCPECQSDQGWARALAWGLRNPDARRRSNAAAARRRRAAKKLAGAA